eukprot:3435270-Pyramimonas_sp.AAC.1
MQRLFVAIGDFNIHDEPPASYVEPAPLVMTAPAGDQTNQLSFPTRAGDQHQQAFWRRLFSDMVE